VAARIRPRHLAQFVAHIGVTAYAGAAGPIQSDASANALAYQRTTGELLYLAYGMTANATSGGFFPNGSQRHDRHVDDGLDAGDGLTPSQSFRNCCRAAGALVRRQ
jgi:hypothetical protein